MKISRNDSKNIALCVLVAMVLLLAFGNLAYNSFTMQVHHYLDINANAGLGVGAEVGMSGNPVHMQVTITSTKPGFKTLTYYHAGHITYLGLNETFAKLTGNTTVLSGGSMQWGTLANMWAANLTVIGVGWNDTAAQVNQSANYVMHEWCRINCTNTVSNGALGQYNFTATILTPGTNSSGEEFSGASPYTAQWIGLYYYNGTAAGGGYGFNDATMFAYDTLPNQATGIDSTYSISINFYVSATG